MYFTNAEKKPGPDLKPMTKLVMVSLILHSEDEGQSSSARP